MRKNAISIVIGIMIAVVALSATVYSVSARQNQKTNDFSIAETQSHVFSKHIIVRGDKTLDEIEATAATLPEYTGVYMSDSRGKATTGGREVTVYAMPLQQQKIFSAALNVPELGFETDDPVQIYVGGKAFEDTEVGQSVEFTLDNGTAVTATVAAKTSDRLVLPVFTKNGDVYDLEVQAEGYIVFADRYDYAAEDKGYPVITYSSDISDADRLKKFAELRKEGFDPGELSIVYVGYQFAATEEATYPAFALYVLPALLLLCLGVLLAQSVKDATSILLPIAASLIFGFVGFVAIGILYKLLLEINMLFEAIVGFLALTAVTCIAALAGNFTANRKASAATDFADVFNRRADVAKLVVALLTVIAAAVYCVMNLQYTLAAKQPEISGFTVAEFVCTAAVALTAAFSVYLAISGILKTVKKNEK